MATKITIDLRQVARGLAISLRQVQAVVELLDEGNTVPFITRYRKDQTGGLNEEQIRQIQARLRKLRLLAERKQTILRSIQSQGKLTEELQRQILAAGTLKRLEDLYLPFKPRKQTLATLARSRGLEQLANEILSADPICADLDARAKDFISVERKVSSAAEALLGAGHILAEQFSENAQLRQRLREILQRTGKFVCCQAPTIAAQAEVTTTRKGKDSSQLATSAGSAVVGQGKVQEPAVSAVPNALDASSGQQVAAAAAGSDLYTETVNEDRKADESSENSAINERGSNGQERQTGPNGDTAQNQPVASEQPITGADHSVQSDNIANSRQPLLPFMSEDGSVADSEGFAAPSGPALAACRGSEPGQTTSDKYGQAVYNLGGQATEAQSNETVATVGATYPVLFDLTGSASTASHLDAFQPCATATGPQAEPEALRLGRIASEPAEPEQPAVSQRHPGSTETKQSEQPSLSSPADQLHPAAPASPGSAPTASESTIAETTATESTTTESATTESATAESTATESTQCGGPAGDAAAVVARQTTASVARLSKKELKKKRLEERRIKAFRDYFDYQEEIRKIPPHRLLAINRGERAGILKVKLEYDLPAMHQVLEEMLIPPDHPHADYLRGCARDALTRLILPSLEREVRRDLTDRAEMHAVGVFAKNLRNLLLQPPVRDHRVLAIDPGFKSGCKLVALDQFGNVLEHAVIYLVGKAERRRQAKEKLIDLVTRHQLTVIAIGNGTACRHTEDFVAQLLDGELKGRNIAYVIVNEAGASAYSTSRVGREELPQYDASVRGAISIGRRLLDPLSELVKIDPASIGVGLYQHDVKAKHLRASLDEVVESCVNFVGVDVNTASPALLRYVSGLNQLTARRVYEYRREHGPFQSRQQLREVPGIGEATFVQAAGFLRITGGSNPLDATWIHPESYEVTNQLLAQLGFTASDLTDKSRAAQLAERAAAVDRASLARQLGIGAHTLEDILSQLVRPGRDPREDFPQPVFKHGAMKLEDLTPGMELTGTVSNVVDFGAFVDIGMHDSGLVHVSHLSDKFVRDPHEVVAVGDIVRVWVLHVDKERRRVSLTMVKPGTERQRGQRPAPASPARQHNGKSPRVVRRDAAQDAAAQKAAGTAAAQPVADVQPQPAADNKTGRRGSRKSTPAGQVAAAASEGKRAAGAQTSQRRDQQSKPPQRRGPERGSYQPKPKPKPVVRITEAMRAGKEPMRTFGELLQFYTEKQQQSAAMQKQQQVPPPSRGEVHNPSEAGGANQPASPVEPTGPVATARPSEAAAHSGTASAGEAADPRQASGFDPASGLTQTAGHSGPTEPSDIQDQAQQQQQQPDATSTAAPQQEEAVSSAPPESGDEAASG